MHQFILHIGNIPAALRPVSFDGNGKQWQQWLEFGGFRVAVEHPEQQHLQVGRQDFFLTGKIDNLTVLAANAGIAAADSDIVTGFHLLQQNGWEGTRQWKGAFAVILYDNDTKVLQYSIGNTGLMQAYIHVSPHQAVITSSLKALRNNPLVERSMIPIDSYRYAYTKNVAPDFCFLQQFRRVIPGYAYLFDVRSLDVRNHTAIAIQPIEAIACNFRQEDAAERLYELIHANVQDKIHSNSIGIPVSGGVDSGLIAALLHQSCQPIRTYTIGTDFGNEYEQAFEVHRHTDSIHQEIHVDTEGCWEGLLQSVWHNEICDPLYAEGFVGFYHVFKAAQSSVTQIFTGYGADLILGDFLQIEDRSNINAFSEYWCRRAAWTGEMSPFLAESFGLNIQHPFWETELIQFSLSIPYAYKYRGQEVKALLREMAVNKKILPHDIAWRKKNAFTTGASLDQLFSHTLGIPHDKTYRFKSIFLYYLFECLFVKDEMLRDIDFQQLITKTNNYVRQHLA